MPVIIRGDISFPRKFMTSWQCNQVSLPLFSSLMRRDRCCTLSAVNLRWCGCVCFRTACRDEPRVMGTSASSFWGVE